MNQVEQMIQKLKEDQEFARKISSLPTKEEVVAAALQEGFQISTDDIDGINEAIQQELVNSIDQSVPAGKFLARMLTDQNFAQEVMAKTEVEEVLVLAREQGINLIAQDVAEVNQTLRALSGRSAVSAPQNGELTEGDLEQVAGGTELIRVGESIMMSAVVTATVIAQTVLTVVSTVIGVSMSLVTPVVIGQGERDDRKRIG